MLSFQYFQKKPALSNANILYLNTAKKITRLFCLVSGLGFHFEINDLPMFLKGANWIPAGISIFSSALNSFVGAEGLPGVLGVRE